MDLSKLSDTPFHSSAATIEYIKGNKKAILFLHGFPSSPASYVEAAKLVLKLNYDVFVPRIPSFASDYNLFMQTCFNDWFEYIKNYYLKYRTKYKKFYVVGTSMGGSMALKLAQHFCNSSELKPTAITTIAAPVFINRYRMGIVTQPLAPLLPIVAPFVKAIKPALRFPTNEQRQGMEKWTGYNGIFTRQTISFFKALKRILKDLKKVDVPLLLIHDRSDKTVPYQNMAFIADRVSSPCVATECYNFHGLKESCHVLLLYKSVCGELIERIDNFFSSRETKTAKKIDSLSLINEK